MGRVTTDGVNATEIASYLGVTGSVDLCHSEAVNRYSMVKPINVDSVKTLTETDFQQANWGYSIPSAQLPAAIIDYVLNGNLPTGWTNPRSETHRMMDGYWAYEIPQGRVRLLDFDGYIHSVESLFSMRVQSAGADVENLYNSATSVVFDFSSSQNCELEEFVNMRRGASTPMYYGVLSFDADGVGYEYFNTSSKMLTINNSEFSQFFRSATADGKQIYLMPCVCATLCNKDGWATAGKPAIIPLCAPTKVISYYTAQPIYIITSKYAYRSSGKAITWNVSVQNTGTSAGDVTIKVEDVGNSIIYTNQSKSIAAGASVSWSGVQSYTGSVSSVQQLKVTMIAGGKTTISYISVTDNLPRE